MAENTKASILAVVQETTAGTYKAISAGTEFIPLREGFSFVPNLETLTTDEIRSSIGPSAPLAGNESPTASVPEYLKHSGTEGTAPNWGPLIESAFGSTSSNGTERATTTGSTTTVINLAAGGTDFARGKAILIKDASREIRAVHSVSSNSLTLGFAVPSAPGNAINVGKCVNYAPADSGHQTNTLHLYRGNGGVYEALAGGVSTSMNLSFNVGEPIECNFDVQGSQFFMNPIVVASTNKYLDFTNDDGTFVATVTEGTYRTPVELAQAIEDAMNAISTGETHTVTFNSIGANKGKFTILCTGTVLSLLWKTGTHGSDNLNDHIANLIGFSDAANDTGTAATTGYTSDNVITYTAFLPAYGSWTVSAANQYLDFTDADGTFTATVANATYTSPFALATAISTAMNTANAGETHTCTFHPYGTKAGKFSISFSGATTSLLWKTGTHGSDLADDHIGTLIGFSDAADDTGSTRYFSDTAVSFATSVTPTYDNTSVLVAKNMEVLVGDQSTYDSVCVSSLTATLNNTVTQVECISAESGVDSIIVTARQAEIQLVAQLSRHDVDKFDRYINNSDVRMQFTFGTKSGGNWVAGVSGCLYVPVAKISAYEHGDLDGLVTMQYTISPYVDSSGNGEIYLNFL